MMRYTMTIVFVISCILATVGIAGMRTTHEYYTQRNEQDRRYAEVLRRTNDSLRAELSLRPRDLRVERDSLVVRTARTLGLSPILALGIAYVENPRGDSTAVSTAGALGLMQVMPPEALRARGNSVGAGQRGDLIVRLCGAVDRILERECNVRVGLHIYRDYLHQYEEEDLALAAYNGALRYPRAAAMYVSAVRAHQERLAGET